MKFFSSITALVTLVSALAIPTATNYQLLVNAINDFQATSSSSFELIMAALAQEKALLNQFSPSTLGNVTIFVPSDAGFLSLNIGSLSKNDLYTYLQYHVALNAPVGEPRHVKTYLGDDVALNYTSSALTQVISRFGLSSTVLGSVSPIPNIVLNFMVDVLRPPVNLALTVAHYNYTNYTALLTASKNLTLATVSKDNTFLIPSEAAISAFVAAQGSPSNYTADHFTALMNYHTINASRIYSEDFAILASQNISSITTSSNMSIQFTIVNGTVTLHGAYGNASITTSNILTEHGVVHVIDAILAPLNVTY